MLESHGFTESFNPEEQCLSFYPIRCCLIPSYPHIASCEDFRTYG